MSARVALAALLAGFAIALLMGCGINTQDAGKPNPNAPTATGTSTAGTSTVDSQAAKDLPKRPKGVVAVDGPIQGSLTPRAIQQGIPGVQVNFHNGGESEGFADLCTGKIDVLDTSRLITPAERRVCERNGLDLVAPIQVASDAVVIATRNESDVGGDCLRISTVNDIFRAGSPITNWSQVGFFDIPLRVTGREAPAPAFQFFAQSVLGVPSNASLSDVRSDYILHTTDDGVRREVTSEARVARVLAQIDRENKRRADQKITLTETQKLLIARSNRRRIDAAIRAAQNRALVTFQFPRLTFARSRYRNALHNARLSGTIGIFRFSYYELYENLLRPMEIWDPQRAADTLSRMTGVRVVRGTGTATTTTTTATTGTTSTATTTTSTTASGDVVVNPDLTPWCVFPSQTTITNGSYPLSRPIYLYVAKLNLQRDEVKTFLRTYLNNAQALASRNRLVQIPDTLLEDNLAIVEGRPVSTGTSTTGATPSASTTATVPSGNVPGVATPSAPTSTTSTTSTTRTTATTP